MKFLKAFILILVLLIGNACSLGTIMDNDKPTEFIFAPDKTNSLVTKELPARYLIDPLPNIDIQAEAGILLNATTGEILFEKNINQSLSIASMSKIMTELLVLEAVEEGGLSWEDTVPISDYDHLISNYPGFASIQLQQDRDYSVRELFNAMAISSANGATIALAEAVGDTEEQFVHLMNSKAEQLELLDSNFVNSTGLTNIDLQNHHSVGEIHDSNMMSAENLASLSQYILKQFPELIEITKIKELDFLGDSHQSSNWMLPGTDNEWINEDVTFQGVDGLKTGYTSDAGYGFTGTVKIDKRRFISVIIGTKDIADRFVETKLLYETISQQLKEVDKIE